MAQRKPWEQGVGEVACLEARTDDESGEEIRRERRGGGIEEDRQRTIFSWAFGPVSALVSCPDRTGSSTQNSPVTSFVFYQIQINGSQASLVRDWRRLSRVCRHGSPSLISMVHATGRARDMFPPGLARRESYRR